eukprot:16090266-Heterocapsa_arctica.AAC.1
MGLVELSSEGPERHQDTGKITHLRFADGTMGPTTIAPNHVTPGTEEHIDPRADISPVQLDDENRAALDVPTLENKDEDPGIQTNTNTHGA